MSRTLTATRATISVSATPRTSTSNVPPTNMLSAMLRSAATLLTIPLSRKLLKRLNKAANHWSNRFALVIIRGSLNRIIPLNDRPQHTRARFFVQPFQFRHNRAQGGIVRPLREVADCFVRRVVVDPGCP